MAFQPAFTQRREGKSKGAKGKQNVFAVLFHLGAFA
jgi:hypothetical protein